MIWRWFLIILVSIGVSACQALPSQSSDALQVVATPCTTNCNGTPYAISVRDNMFFSIDNITIDAGQPLAIDFANTSRLPHNLVIIDGDMAVAIAVNRDAINQADYLPQHPAVIVSLPIVMPNQTGSITWDSPQPGTYLFICTYPGHFDAGMYGSITVK
jgi:uncharacterized cupredoxin-like copper-binding protein